MTITKLNNYMYKILFVALITFSKWAFADCIVDTDTFEKCLKCCGAVAEVSDINENSNSFKEAVKKACNANKATLAMKVESGKTNLSHYEANAAVSAISLQYACENINSPSLITYSECVKKCDGKKSESDIPSKPKVGAK